MGTDIGHYQVAFIDVKPVGRQSVRDEQILVSVVVDVCPQDALGFVRIIRQIQFIRDESFSIAQVKLQIAHVVGNAQIVQPIAVEVRHAEARSQIAAGVVGPNVHFIADVHKRGLSRARQRCEQPHEQRSSSHQPLGRLKQNKMRCYFLGVQHMETNLVPLLTGHLKIARNFNNSN